MGFSLSLLLRLVVEETGKLYNLPYLLVRDIYLFIFGSGSRRFFLQSPFTELFFLDQNVTLSYFLIDKNCASQDIILKTKAVHPVSRFREKIFLFKLIAAAAKKRHNDVIIK